MKYLVNKKLFFVGLFSVCASCCFSQVVRQEGDEFLQKKVVLINTEDKSVSFKISFTVEPDENEQVVKTFLDNNETFRLVELTANDALKTSLGQARTWPQRQGTDGFFIATFERKVPLISV